MRIDGVRVRRRVTILAAIALAAIPLELPGQQQGRIEGTVKDGKGNPLEGVKITITTPAITTFRVELTSRKDGRWGTILSDATRTYTYRFEKPGYLTLEESRKIPILQATSWEVVLLNQQQAIEKGIVKQVVDPFTTAYNEAVDKLKAGDLDGAWAKAEEAVRVGPDKAIGFDLAAKVAVRRKDWDGAVRSAEKSLSLDPDNPGLYGVLLEACRAKGDRAKAAEYEKKFAAANPDNPDILYNQAVELYNKGIFKEAEPVLKKVLQIKPDHPNAHYLIGMCYVNLGNVPEMKQHLNEYLRLEPKGKEASTAREMLEAFK